MSGGLSVNPVRFAPAGKVAHFAGALAPEGWLACNGATISRTAYAALFAAIGTTYGAGDGATTFALPDLRGEFVRGLDSGRGVDTGRELGSAQGHQMPSHTHSADRWQQIAAGVDGTSGNQSSSNMAPTFGNVSTSTTAAGTGAETRPRNVAMLACIKY